MKRGILTEVGRTLLYVVAIAVAAALLDSLLYRMTQSGSLTVLLWATWQIATLGVLAVRVSSLFENVQSVFARRAAVVSVVIVLQAVATYLGFTLFGNVRELFGVPI